MEVGGASQDFMQYLAAIEQASFGSRSAPVGVDAETVVQISKNANSKARNDQLESVMNASQANHQARMSLGSSDTYSKGGGMNISKGTSFAIEV